MIHVKHIFLISALMICFNANSQTVVLHKDSSSEAQYRNTEFGENQDHFSHLYFGGGFIVSPDHQGARILYGKSAELHFGLRFKYKITAFYSWGWETGFSTTMYKLKQESGKILPDTLLNKKERMDFGRIGLAVYNRFNFDVHRGDFIGTYLDLGGRFAYQYAEHITKNTNVDGSKNKKVDSSLPYTNKWAGEVFVRLGRSHFELYGSYLLTELFKSGYTYPELPKVVVGLNIGIY